MGQKEDPEVEAALSALVSRLQPELLVASGDLTHRGRPEEHDRTHRFLVSLGPPVLAVPGNHDLPYTFPARFTRPWQQFERVWKTAEPTYASPTLHVIGLNSARPFRHQGGALPRAQLERAGATLRTARTASPCSTTTSSEPRGGRRASDRCHTVTPSSVGSPAAGRS